MVLAARGRQIRRYSHAHGASRPAGLGLDQAARALRRPAEIDRLQLARRSGQVEQVAQDAVDPFRLARDPLDVIAGVLALRDSLAKDVDVRDHRRHRVADLVGHAGREPAHAGEPLAALHLRARRA